LRPERVRVRVTVTVRVKVRVRVRVWVRVRVRVRPAWWRRSGKGSVAMEPLAVLP
jgi:hypothetical protein